jgi:hypothetical protein
MVVVVVAPLHCHVAVPGAAGRDGWLPAAKRQLHNHDDVQHAKLRHVAGACNPFVCCTIMACALVGFLVHAQAHAHQLLLACSVAAVNICLSGIPRLVACRFSAPLWAPHTAGSDNRLTVVQTALSADGERPRVTTHVNDTFNGS